MLNLDSRKLLKALPVLLLSYSIQASPYITTSENARHLRYKVPVNKSLLVNLDRRAAKIIEGNNEIADVIADMKILSPNQLLLRGKHMGATNATILDANNRVAMVIDVEVTHNLDGLKEKLYQLLPGERIEVRSVESCIVLSGEISNIVKMDYAMKIAQGYAQTSTSGGGGSRGGCNGVSSGGGGGGGGGSGGGGGVNNIINMMHVGGEQQVMLEVKIAEVQRNLVRKFSLDKGASKAPEGVKDGSFTWSTQSGSTVLDFAGNALAGYFFGGAFVSGDTLFNWSLNLNRNTDVATILAEPNLTTLSGKQAAFLSGGEFPISACNNTGLTGDGGPLIGGITGLTCTVTFKRFGIGLEFTPIILNANRINLHAHVSVSQLSRDAEAFQTTRTIAPSLNTREADSTVELNDGQTMSIAGLISENNSNTQVQAPGFADIPILGSLFRNRDSLKQKKELIILVTPHLAKPIPRDQIWLPTDNYVAPDDVDFYLLGRMEARKNKQVALAPAFNSNSGGTTGQFGHQINDGGKP